MAAAILSQDFLAVCLVLSGGDLDFSITEIARHVKDYQESQDRHFGISRSDFQSALYLLVCYEMGKMISNDDLNFVKIRDIVNAILKYYDVYFNDEGEHWTVADGSLAYRMKYNQFESWYGYDATQYYKKKRNKAEMKWFFGDCRTTILSRESVRKFMNDVNITDAILWNCSRPGKAS